MKKISGTKSFKGQLNSESILTGSGYGLPQVPVCVPSKTLRNSFFSLFKFPSYFFVKKKYGKK